MPQDTESVLYDAAAIMQILPHRYPFLMIDRIVEVGEKHAVAIKNVTINEPYFPGHFPDHPIVPGVLIAESMAQTAAFIGRFPATADTAAAASAASENPRYYVAGLNLKIHRSVVPGDRMVVHMSSVANLGAMKKCRGEVLVDRRAVATGEFNLVRKG